MVCLIGHSCWAGHCWEGDGDVWLSVNSPYSRRYLISSWKCKCMAMPYFGTWCLLTTVSVSPPIMYILAAIAAFACLIFKILWAYLDGICFIAIFFLKFLWTKCSCSKSHLLSRNSFWGFCSVAPTSALTLENYHIFRFTISTLCLNYLFNPLSDVFWNEVDINSL